jgi:hypothetical protein
MNIVLLREPMLNEQWQLRHHLQESGAHWHRAYSNITLHQSPAADTLSCVSIIHDDICKQ